MSELTITRPEVLTDHTDIICSTSIERIVTGRNAALEQIKTLIRQLADISTLTSSIGGGDAKDWGMRQYRYDCWLMEDTDTAMKAITRSFLSLNPPIQHQKGLRVQMRAQKQSNKK